MRRVLWILTLLLIVVMPYQQSVHVGGTERPVTRTTTETLRGGSPAQFQPTDIKREGGANVTLGDTLLVFIFLLWAGYVAVTFRFAEVRWPLFAVFVLLALVLAAALRSGHLKPGLRESLQLGAYFAGGWFVFANCIGTRPRLRAAAEVFTLVVAVVVLVALFQYRSSAVGNVFSVGGTFANRNTLGAFLAVALPFVFALALYEERLWQRFALMLTVAFGVAVTLSGGALVAIVVSLLFIAALKSRWALVGVLIAMLLAVTLVAGLMPARHTDTLVASVQPYVKANYLDRSVEDPSAAADPSSRSVVAVRYKRWHAAIRQIRRHCRWPFLGEGPGRFNEAVGVEYGDVDKPSGDTDVTSNFNVSAAEPDTFNMYLVMCVGAGPLALLALLWVGARLLGRSLREHRVCCDDFGRALALGAAGAVVGAALCGIFSNVLVRGIALPFIFVALSGILWATLPERPARRG